MGDENCPSYSDKLVLITESALKSAIFISCSVTALPFNLFLLTRLWVNKALVTLFPGLIANGGTAVWHSCLDRFPR